MNSTASAIGDRLPFLHLLSEAENVAIHEIGPDKPEPPVEFSRAANARTFLIRIEDKKPAAPIREATPESRAFLLESAALLLSDKDYVLARNVYSYLLKLNIRDVDAMKGLGICFFRLGEMKSAGKCFLAAKELGINDSIHLWIAKCLSQDGQNEKALEELQKISAESKKTPDLQCEYYKELGNCQNRLGRYAEALEGYKAAASLDPQSELFVNLGTVELHRKEFSSAKSYFEKAIELNPANARARCGLGVVFVETGKLKEAEKQFHESLDQDPLCAVALYQLLSMAFRSGEFEGVLFKITAFLAKNPKDLDVRYALAVIYFKKSDWGSCEKEVNKILEIDPKHVRARGMKEQLAAQRFRR